MDITKKDILVATIKGGMGAIPFAGSFLTEYFGLIQDGVASKRAETWAKMLDDTLARIAKLESDMERLADNEFFYSCVQTATGGALKSFQDEKRVLFANALYNSYGMADVADEKKAIFISLIDRYTLLSIKVLSHFSEDRSNQYNNAVNVDSRNMVKTYISPRQEYLYKAIGEYISELKNQPEFAKTIFSQLYNDGLIEFVDNMPAYPDRYLRKQTTAFGDQFIAFITAND